MDLRTSISRSVGNGVHNNRVRWRDRGGGTPVGTYTLTVTGTFTSGSTALTHATMVTLVVQSWPREIQADPDIPILKEAKSEYARLQ